MCAIIGWVGILPPKLLAALLVEASCRGVDSTGLAFRYGDGNTRVVKQAVSSPTFVKLQKGHILSAEASSIGLGHTRRASKGMPVDNTNAHPFAYKKYIFAHNGFISNWKQFADQETTDSMILGKYIDKLDFSDLTGCLGLIWMYQNNLFIFKSCQDLTVATIVWKSGGIKFNATIVASTWPIIDKALDKINVTFEANQIFLNENECYQVKTTGVDSLGEVAVHPNNVKDLDTTELDKELDRALKGDVDLRKWDL